MMYRHIALAALAAGVAACSQDRAITGPAAATAARLAASAAAEDGAPGAVYTLMNLTSGNAVAVFARAADGTLSAAGTVATGGTGTGSGLGSQGALALSDDISVLRVSPTGLSLIGRYPSGGAKPISLTVHDELLYVLNGGGSGNV